MRFLHFAPFESCGRGRGRCRGLRRGRCRGLRRGLRRRQTTTRYLSGQVFIVALISHQTVGASVSVSYTQVSRLQSNTQCLDP